MVMDNGNFLKKKNYLNHFNGHYIGSVIHFMGYYGRTNGIYGILGVAIKIYETPGVAQGYASTHTLLGSARSPLHITPTTEAIYTHIKTQQISGMQKNYAATIIQTMPTTTKHKQHILEEIYILQVNKDKMYE
eukprot:104276_1